MSGDHNVCIERANKDYQGISFEMALILGEGLKHRHLKIIDCLSCLLVL
jgi:hypothetical protein